MTDMDIVANVKEIQDVISNMRLKEKKFHLQLHDYLNPCDESSCLLGIKEHWRTRMCEWAYAIIDHYRCERFVVNIAFNYIDRYLSIISKDNEENENKKLGKYQFQLISITSVYIAFKLNRPQSVKAISLIDEFASLSRGSFDRSDIQKMECNLLFTLKWEMNPPSSESFALHLLQYIPSHQSELLSDGSQILDHDNQRSEYKYHMNVFTHQVLHEIYERACLFTELAVGSYEVSCHQLPSHIALASILGAMDTITDYYIPSQSKIAFMNIAKDLMYLKSDEFENIFIVGHQIRRICPDMFQCQERFPISIHEQRDASTDSRLYALRKRTLSPSSAIEFDSHDYTIDYKKSKRRT